MKYKNIIWDWNGTIVDDAYLFVDIMNKTLDKYSEALKELDCKNIADFTKQLIGSSYNTILFMNY